MRFLRSSKRKSKPNIRRAHAMLIEGLQSRQLLAADLQLVKDINTETEYVSVSLYARPVEVFNGIGFVSKPSIDFGVELWRTDGTVAGTSMLMDIAQGPDSSSPRDVIVSGDSVYFLAQSFPITNPFVYSLWTTKGTTETTELVQANNRDGSELVTSPRSLVTTSDGLFFIAEDFQGKRELWQAVGNKMSVVEMQGLAAIFDGVNGIYTVNDHLVFSGITDAGQVGLFSLATDTFQAEMLTDGIHFDIAKSSDAQTLWITATDIESNQTQMVTDGTLGGSFEVENAQDWYWTGFRDFFGAVGDRMLALPIQQSNGMQQLVAIDRQGNVEVLETFDDAYVSLAMSPAVDGKAILSPQGMGGPSFVTGGTAETTQLLTMDNDSRVLLANSGVAWNSKLAVPSYLDGRNELVLFDLNNSDMTTIDSGSADYGWTRFFNLTATDEELFWLDPIADTLKKSSDGVGVEVVSENIGISGPVADLGTSKVLIGASPEGLFIGSVEDEAVTLLSPTYEISTRNGVYQDKSVVWNDQVFFFAYVNDRIQLWRTDGTEIGTVALSDYEFGSLAMLIATDSGVAVIDRGGVNPSNLWFTDGNADNTSRKASINGEIDWAIGLGDGVVVSSLNEVVRWDVANGTSELIRNFQGEKKSFALTPPVVQGDRLYLPVVELTALEDGSVTTKSAIYESDGTSAGTRIVTADDAEVTGWERARVFGDRIYVMNHNKLFVTRDGFQTTNLVLEAEAAILDVAVGDGTVYTTSTTNDFATGIYRLKESTNENRLVGKFGFNGLNFYDTRFTYIDSEIYVWANDPMTSDLLVQKIDDATGALKEVPVLSDFRYSYSWAPVSISEGIIGPTMGPSVGQELYIVPTDGLEILDSSGPKNVYLDPRVIPENSDIGSEIGTLITEAKRTGFYRYAFVDGQDPNDNDSFEIKGDRLITKIAFDREVKSEYVIEVKSTSLSGAWKTFQVRFFITDPVQPPTAKDDWGSGMANDTVIIDLMSNDVEGSLGMNGAWIEMLTMPENGTVEIGDDGKVHFHPDDNFVGKETIQYIIYDSLEFSSEPASVTFEVHSRYKNIDKPTDVNMDGKVTALDALRIINFLNKFGLERLDQSSVDSDSSMIDVNGNGWSNPMDALMVINYLNMSKFGNGEGEGGLDASIDSIATARSAWQANQDSATAAADLDFPNSTGSYEVVTLRRRRR